VTVAGASRSVPSLPSASAAVTAERGSARTGVAKRLSRFVPAPEQARERQQKRGEGPRKAARRPSDGAARRRRGPTSTKGWAPRSKVSGTRR